VSFYLTKPGLRPPDANREFVHCLSKSVARHQTFEF
jgi:hypothetical protein